jgi:hypothetical protein
MPQGAAVTLYVKPYIYRYVVAKLADPERMARDASCFRLLEDLQRVFGRWIERVDDSGARANGQPNGRVVIVLNAPWDLAATKERDERHRINAMLERTFLQEMYIWVDFYRRSMGVHKKKAMQLFFDTYHLSEEDYQLESAMRVYRKHHRRTKRVRDRQPVPPPAR